MDEYQQIEEVNDLIRDYEALQARIAELAANRLRAGEGKAAQELMRAACSMSDGSDFLRYVNTKRSAR